MALRKKRTVRNHKKHGRKGIGHRCRKCGDKFRSKVDLELHISEVHHRKPALNEIRLLEKGYMPSESKLGTPFKGKNKIIIA